MKFEKAVESYLEYAKKRHKKQSFDILLYNFNSNIFEFFKHYDLEDIDNTLISKWQNCILDKNFCNNHNKNLFYMLINFLNYCNLYYNFSKKIIDEILPFTLKVESKKVDFYTLKEFKHFIKFVDNIVYKTFFNFMFFVGTRPGEAMALKFSDVNNLYVTINKTIDSHGLRTVGTPKTLSSNRVVSIDFKLRRDIEKLKKYYFNLYGEYSEEFYIFGGKKPLSPTTINRFKFDACYRAKIRPITLHQFRHSHATLLFNLGIDVHVISKRLGHSKVSTTLDIYTHSNFIQDKRVFKTLNYLRFNFFDILLYNFLKN